MSETMVIDAEGIEETETTIEDKIKFYEDDVHMIKRVEDLCTSLKI